MQNQIHTICFFNYYHNGDVFSGKGYMQNLITMMPWLKFQHAQVNSLKTMRDLACEHIEVKTIPFVPHNVRYMDMNGVLYINTWVGAYGNAVIPMGQHHANWASLYTMWMHIYDVIEQVWSVKLPRSNNPIQYIGQTDWKAYDINLADQWLGQHTDVVLICNGRVRSTQSNLELMEPTLKELSRDFPAISFVCTSKFDTTGFDRTDNIYFTEDIFAGVEGGDINEIAYLSTKAFLVAGKNSGPFMFTHVVENILDPNKIFVSLSHRSSDSYAWGVKGLPCRYYHYSGDDEHNVAGLIRLAINNRGQLGTGEIEEIPQA